jgi:hypothetical protein
MKMSSAPEREKQVCSLRSANIEYLLLPGEDLPLVLVVGGGLLHFVIPNNVSLKYNVHNTNL